MLMAAPSIIQPIEILQEWAPLTDLFSKLPTKAQNGIFTQDVKLTCIDILPEFIAIGTNIGVVFWYDRLKKDLQRLKCEKQSVNITVVKIISTVDYMVASGCSNGHINMFQVPKSHPNSIPENLRPKGKQVERYTVSELHKSAISAIEWAKNGMKLFSGDQTGCIVLTEIDFYMHICKSSEIMNESYAVVQLSYSNQKLLISTTYRTIIAERRDKWRVCQVGKKDRKVLGTFGGIIHQKRGRIGETVVCCTRPGLRIWIADFEGNVNRTLLFKDLLRKECLEVPIINPISKSLKQLKPQKEPTFGVLLPFNDHLLLTYSNDVIYILDPEQMVVISTLSHLRSVLCVSTCKDEIFILEEDRSVIRVSYRPEQPSEMALPSPTTSFLPIPLFKDLTSKLQSTSIIPAISPFIGDTNEPEVSIHTDSTLIVGAEEAKESPIKQNAVHLERKFADIGQREFNDTILFKANAKPARKKHTMSTSMSSLSSSNSSEDKDVLRPSLLSLSSVGVLPDLRSPESIQNDIEYKERILAEILSLDTVKLTSLEVEERKESCDNKFRLVEVENDAEEVRVDKPKRIDQIKEEKVERDGGSGLDTNIMDRIHLNNATPVCVGIPDEWNLTDIKLKTRNEPSISDNSLTDWEII